jgi:hypothetical protein
MGRTNYKLSDEQKKQLDKIADAFIHKLAEEFAEDIGGVLDPYDTSDGKINNDKLTAMLWYVGDLISIS